MSQSAPGAPMTFSVQYYAGTYGGVRTVEADDAEQAVAIVRAWVRREMTLPMYADGYEVVGWSRHE